MIQDHLIRSYTSRGYTLHRGSSFAAFTEYPLGVVSAGVTQSFLAVQKRIDTLLHTGRVSWSMCFRHDDDESPALVGYGGFFEIESHGRREPIIFLHVVALSSPRFLFGVVDGIIKMLSVARVPQLRKDLMALASADASHEELLKRIAGRLDEACSDRQVPAQHPRTSGPAAISHDCAGGPAIAWLTMAASHVQAEPPWEVFDEWTSSDAIQTRSFPEEGSESIRASVILARVAEDYVHRGASTMSKDEERSASSTEVEHTRTEQAPRPDPLQYPETVAVHQQTLALAAPVPSDPMRTVQPDGRTLASRGHQAEHVVRNTSIRFIGLLLALAIALSLTALAVSLGTRAKVEVPPSVTLVKATDPISQQALAIARDARRRIDRLMLPALIDQVAFGSQAEIDAALAELESDWKSDPNIVLMVRTRAGRLKDHVPIKNVASILLHVSPAVLKKHEVEINGFLNSIQGNGRETKQVVNDIRARMGT